MTSSMTAFARRSAEGDWGKATWELRSVNHRYLDVALRLPEELRALESAVRERLQSHLKRGKLDCTLRYEPPIDTSRPLAVNMALVDQLAAAARAVGERLDVAAANPIDLLRWPGVFDSSLPDAERLGEPILKLLGGAIDALRETREREGAKLAGLIEQRCVLARAEVATIRAKLPGIMAEIGERLRGRIAELKADLDPARVEQEVVLMTARLDVAEELDRLDAHLDEVRRVLGERDAIGRRLDFLMQELNREANTLGSKSAHLATTGASVELKVLIEQMREQVQNIE
jgi:uncharacterized protein (TIGR00255 family)